MSTAAQTVDLQEYKVDPAHSRVAFAVRHLGFSKVRGSFSSFEGTVRMEPGDLSTLEIQGAIEAKTVSTNDEKRDAHLRSADFFDVENYPKITFTSTEVTDVNDDTFTLVGNFSLHGETQRIELDAVFLGETEDPWGGTRAGFEARTKVNRKDFGLNWNVALEAGGLLVSEQVELVLEIQAVLDEGNRDAG